MPKYQCCRNTSWQVSKHSSFRRYSQNTTGKPGLENLDNSEKRVLKKRDDGYEMEIEDVEMQFNNNRRTRQGLHDSDFISIGDTESLKGAPEAISLDDLTPEELEKRKKVLQLEYEVLRMSGYLVPENMSEADWHEVFLLNTRTAREKYFRYLRKKESAKLNDRKKRQEKSIKYKEMNAALKAQSNNGELIYALNNNTMFMMIRDATMSKTYNWRVLNAIQHGQSLVFDFDYDQFMQKRECKFTADQFKDCYAYNKSNREPFNIHICNAKPNGMTLGYLHKFLPHMDTANCLLNVHEASYLDMFPKEKLVYLTPHCRQELGAFDHDAVYIVGGMVDKSNPAPFSLAKAKREGIKMAKLPLDQYIDWGCGHKSLTLDQMIRILLEAKNCGDWNAAFKYVPIRKIKRESLPLEDREFGQPVSRNFPIFRSRQRSDVPVPDDILPNRSGSRSSRE